MFNSISLLVSKSFLRSTFRKLVSTTMPLKVAVIGAGAGGLTAMRHLLARKDVFEGVCFEQCPQVGGTWIYSACGKRCAPKGQIGGLLITNLPKEVMAFPDFPFDKSLPSFIRHQDVLQYLEDYSKHFKIKEKIKFQTCVDRVHPVKGDNSFGVKWEVTYCHVLNQEEKKTDVFDAVIVCNGHYSIPIFPDLPGLDQFKGRVLHSHDYREATPLSGQRVVCLGAQSSGQDIMVELSGVAEKVFISHNKAPLKTKLPSNVEQRPGISRFTQDSVIFTNNQSEKIDAVIFCTGYRYTFPFLSEACNVNIDDERVTPLYKHLIHTEFPNLSIIGICKVICPFPQFHFQALVILAVLDGSLQLPSKEDMDSDTETDFQKRLSQGLLPRYAHNMGPRQWEYNDELADMAKCPRLEKRIMDIYEQVHCWRHTDVQNYKKKNIELIEPDSFRGVE